MDLVTELINEGYLKSLPIIKAFKKIKRVDFLLPEYIDQAELNAPLPIGHEQTISQPLTVAFMLELLQPQAGDKILDIGSGSGWTTALLAEIVGDRGRIYSLELIPELCELAEKNVAKYNFINQGTVFIKCADGYRGLPDYAPFDKIIVSAAALEIPPVLINQLVSGGRLVIPVGARYSAQDIVLIKKDSQDKYQEERYPGYIFVPLVKK